MANRVLTSALIVTAVLAIGWLAVVLLWDRAPPVADQAIAEPDAAAPAQVAAQENESQPESVTTKRQESPQSENAPPPVLDTSMGLDGLYRLITEIGIDPTNFSAKMQKFYCDAGWQSAPTQYTLAGCNLEQPYDQYDIETLRQLAEGGDMWAQQFYASLLQTTRPAEAVQWYERAAAQGSASAAESIASVYYNARTDFLNQANLTDPILLEQTLALRGASESPSTLAAAWSGVSNLMAQRYIDSGTLSAYGGSLGPEKFERACDMAEQLFDQLNQDAYDANRGSIPRTVSPMLIGGLPFGESRCPGSRWSDPGTDDCQTFILSFENLPGMPGPQQMPGWICPN